MVDFGCGGGIDVILAAHKTGSDGKVVGIDFAPQMIQRATEAVTESGMTGRAKLIVGDLGSTELPDGFADLVISNCVINLIPDKSAVYREAFRILKPGGTLAISDIVLTEEMNPELRARFRSTWSGCLGGCIPEGEYLEIVDAAGFVGLNIVTRHVLTPEELDAMSRCPGEEFAPAPAKRDVARMQGTVLSIKYMAIRPRRS